MEKLKNKLIGTDKKNKEENRILLLERRGCNFWNDEPLKQYSDLDNYIYFIKNLFIYKKYQTISDFDRCCAEVLRGMLNKYIKVNEPRLKDNALASDFYLYKKDGSCWGMNTTSLYDYTTSYYNSDYILTTINKISIFKYNKLLLINSLNDIEKNLGFRELEIFNKLAYLKEFPTSGNHEAYYFYDDKDNFFIFDFATNNVIG